jgi:hypothetical protein
MQHHQTTAASVATPVELPTPSNRTTAAMSDDLLASLALPIAAATLGFLHEIATLGNVVRRIAKLHAAFSPINNVGATAR